MKSNWPAWVADFRAYFDHVNGGGQDGQSGELHDDAEKALADAEEFLAFIERTPEEIAGQEVEQEITKIEEGLLAVLAIEGDQLDHERAGAELYHRIRELSNNHQGEFTPEQIERVQQAGFRLLNLIFKISPSDIEANIHAIMEPYKHA